MYVSSQAVLEDKIQFWGALDNFLSTTWLLGFTASDTVILCTEMPSCRLSHTHPGREESIPQRGWIFFDLPHQIKASQSP